jgi:hypothetical protein
VSVVVEIARAALPELQLLASKATPAASKARLKNNGSCFRANSPCHDLVHHLQCWAGKQGIHPARTNHCYVQRVR